MRKFKRASYSGHANGRADPQMRVRLSPRPASGMTTTSTCLRTALRWVVSSRRTSRPFIIPHHEGRKPTHGYAATREAAMAAFAKSWRRE
jgi:hypothetical protein